MYDWYKCDQNIAKLPLKRSDSSELNSIINPIRKRSKKFNILFQRFDRLQEIPKQENLRPHTKQEEHKILI